MYTKNVRRIRLGNNIKEMENRNKKRLWIRKVQQIFKKWKFSQKRREIEFVAENRTRN